MNFDWLKIIDDNKINERVVKLFYFYGQGWEKRISGTEFILRGTNFTTIKCLPICVQQTHTHTQIQKHQLTKYETVLGDIAFSANAQPHFFKLHYFFMGLFFSLVVPILLPNIISGSLQYLSSLIIIHKFVMINQKNWF